MLLLGKSSTTSSYTDALIMYFFLFMTTLLCVVYAVKGQVSSAEDLSSSSSTDNTAHNTIWYTIEGRVLPPVTEKKPGSLQHHQSSSSSNSEWTTQIQVLVNGGENIGHIKEDGTFVIHGVTSGSHVIDVIHPTIHYESARVDITSKGKIRARKVNHLQPSLVTHVVYPLRLTPLGQYRYFQAREQWRITDVLLSPMVLMMVLPLILIVILPKMMNDPETRKEMESVQLPKYEMPEVSEMLTSFFGGGGASPNNHENGGSGKKAIRAKKSN